MIQFESVGKKFSKSLQRSMFYGALDVFQTALGRMPDSTCLRPDEFWAIDGVSFELKKGETLGIIGSNGSGKTTLLRMLNGIFMPDKGRITIQGKVGALIQVGAGFHPLLSGRDNIYINGAILGMTKKEIDQKFDSIVDFADIGDFLDAPVKHYSSGMFVRLGFAIAIHCEPDILLIDEILSVGDLKFQLKCNKFITENLLKRGCTIVFVSHNRYAIQDICQKVLYLSHGRMIQLGETTEVMNRYLNDIQEKKVEQSSSLQTEDSLRIEFLDGQGQAKSSFKSGEKVRIRFHYKFDDSIVRPSVGITFVHADTRFNVVSNTDYLFNVHSGYDGLNVPRLGGKGYFEVEFDHWYLPVGIYRYLTYIFSENNTNLFYKNEDAGEVEIVWSENSSMRSLMDLPHRWSVQPNT
ncbi:MAG: ABC transporter ATP-binding protein [Candidatus Omnitrophica bacterium]|nr:ABC transporter ATP-binding protein [Candidatus Omnitrophota bacterium]